MNTMKALWPDERCILCLGTPQPGTPMTARSDAHVIPRAIGGRLSARFLCKRCNGRMGQFEATLAQDVSVGALVDRLEAQLPEKVIKSIRNRRRYFTNHLELGRVEAAMNKKGNLQPKESETFKSEENALMEVHAELDRIGARAAERGAFADAYDQAVPGDWVDVRPGFEIRKPIDLTDVPFTPSLTEPTLTPPWVLVGIGYLYLALCVDEGIYDPVLQPVRDALQAALDGDPTAAGAFCCANRHGTRIVEPVHMLRAKPDDDGTIVTFQVFRELVWRVRFPGVVNPEQTPYSLNIATGEERWMSRPPSKRHRDARTGAGLAENGAATALPCGDTATAWMSAPLGASLSLIAQAPPLARRIRAVDSGAKRLTRGQASFKGSSAPRPPQTRCLGLLAQSRSHALESDKPRRWHSGR